MEQIAVDDVQIFGKFCHLVFVPNVSGNRENRVRYKPAVFNDDMILDVVDIAFRGDSKMDHALFHIHEKMIIFIL